MVAVRRVMRSFASLVATSLLLASVVAGCAEASAPGSQEQDETEARLVTVELTLQADLRGTPGGSDTASRANVQAACDRWEDLLVEMVAPAEVRGVDCSAIRALSGGSTVQHAVSAVATVAARVPEGSEPRAFDAAPIMGATQSGETDAIVAWEGACEAGVRRAKAVYGDRLIGASCGTPQAYVTGSIVGYRSSLSLWTAPLDGSRVALRGYAIGRASTEPAAHAAWRASCEDWLGRVGALSGADRLDEHACGTPRQLSAGSTWILESAPTASLAVRLVDGTEPTSTETTVNGATSSDEVAAAENAVAACEAAIATEKAELGGRFLGGSCAPRKTSGGSVTAYAATVTVWAGHLAPVEAPAPDGDGDADGDGAGGAPPGPTPPDPTRSEPAADCTPRCLAMMDACDAGPRESTCEYVCGDGPTEGELACAEAIDCEDISAWFNVCGLGV